MSFTKLDIINLAFINLGITPSNSLDEVNKQNNAIKFFYEIIKESELRAFNWNFAIKRAKLVHLVEPAISDFENIYNFPVPTDFLKLLYVNANSSATGYLWGLNGLDYYMTNQYQLEGRNIVTNSSSPLFIKYISNVDETLFDPSFIDVFACSLSIKLADIITQDTQKLSAVSQMYQAAKLKAQMANAFEIPPQRLLDQSFILARY